MVDKRTNVLFVRSLDMSHLQLNERVMIMCRPWFTFLNAVCVVLWLTACIASDSQEMPPRPTIPTRPNLLPPIEFAEKDLIGQWKSILTLYAIETLIINDDYTFVQIYETEKPPRRYEGVGSWRIEQRESGCLYVHFEGMRYFYSGEAFEVNGNRFTPGGEPYPFWERCEAQHILMPDKVTLTVVAQPRLPRGIMLLFPATSSDPMSGESMRLVADAQGQLMATPTPPGP